MKRGQGAMEFLMTYGWAILVILIVLGALFYLGIFDFETPNSCNLEAPFICKDIQIKENGVVVSIGSKHIQSGTVTSITVNGYDCNIVDGILTDNSVNNIECITVEDLSGKASVVIDIDYTKQSGLTHSISGKGSGQVEREIVVVSFESCKDILDNLPDSEDGIYNIDPDGVGELDSFSVYCDMTNGGWTKIEFSGDLPHANRWSSDAWRWLPFTFQTVLSTEQIQAVQAVSTEGKQIYDGTCQGVLHWEYGSGNYAYAFGFKFLNGENTNYGTNNLGVDFTVIEDECKANDSILRHTIWEIRDVRVPIINVYSRDNGANELFGSALTQNPAWLK